MLLTVWIVLCLGFPQVMNAVEDAPNSIFGQIGGFFADLAETIPAGIWGLAGIAFVTMSLVISYLILRKQQVTA